MQTNALLFLFLKSAVIYCVGSGGNIRYVEIHRATLAISHHIVKAPQPGAFTVSGLIEIWRRYDRIV